MHGNRPKPEMPSDTPPVGPRSPHEPDRVLHARWRHAGPSVPDIAPPKRGALIRATNLPTRHLVLARTAQQTRHLLFEAVVHGGALAARPGLTGGLSVAARDSRFQRDRL